MLAVAKLTFQRKEGRVSRPTDQLREEKLSATGKLLLNLRNEILEVWKSDLRRESSRAAELTTPILINTLPAFIDNLAEAISPDYPRNNAAEDNTIAEEHGGERARLSNYRLGDLITEYQVLRDAVLSVLSRKIEVSRDELRIIQSSFNQSIRQAATAFALVHTEIREQFVATLTHDLRNPLNSISMASQLLQDADELSHDSRTLVSKISENTRRMDKMIQDLLDVTYVRAGGRLTLRIQETSLLSIIQSVLSHMTLSFGKKFVIEGDDVKGCWDSEALRRAIENLATNAVKYGDATTSVTVKIFCQNGRMILKVHNWGDPIPVGEQESIFQAYRRSRNQSSKKGWGIGLPLVRAVAEAHGGSLGLDSALERGTTFILDIPVDARPYEDAPTTPQ